MQEQMNGESNKQALLEARLTDTEKGNLFAFCQNPAMVHAVEKALTYSLYQMGTVEKGDKAVMDVNWAFMPHALNITDEQLGHELRVKIDALSFLDDAIKQIKKFGVEKLSPTATGNPAL